VHFDATCQLLIIYSAFVKLLRKKREYKEAVYQLFVDCKKAYDSGGRSCIIFSPSLYPHETGEANETVSDLNV